MYENAHIKFKNWRIKMCVYFSFLHHKRMKEILVLCCVVVTVGTHRKGRDALGGGVRHQEGGKQRTQQGYRWARPHRHHCVPSDTAKAKHQRIVPSSVPPKYETRVECKEAILRTAGCIAKPAIHSSPRSAQYLSKDSSICVLELRIGGLCASKSLAQTFTCTLAIKVSNDF